MARNPELDHEFNEGKPEEKRVFFPSADMGATSNGSFMRQMNNGKFFADMAAQKVQRTGFKKSVPALIGLGLLIAALVCIWFFANANSPAPPPPPPVPVSIIIG